MGENVAALGGLKTSRVNWKNKWIIECLSQKSCLPVKKNMRCVL